MNDILRKFSTNRGWTFITNNNIQQVHLFNRSGLHLSREGSSLVASNLLKNVITNWNNKEIETVPCDINNFSLSLIQHTRGFKIASLNIVSPLANNDELRLSMEDQHLDVLAVNESIANWSIHIPGYDIVRRDRNRNGGGVCVYSRSTINFNERTTLRNDNYEAIVDICKPNSRPFQLLLLTDPRGPVTVSFSVWNICYKNIRLWKQRNHC